MTRCQILFGGGALAALLITALGWMIGDDNSSLTNSRPNLALSANRTSNPALCGPNAAPKPSPPAEGMFAMLMYPNRAPARVTLLPAAKICDRLNNPADDPESDLATIGVLLKQYWRATGAMPQGGLNVDITRRLQGRNPQGIALIPKVHPAVSRENELLDRWGTPYEFHPVSAQVMTLRSAGPDRKMWTQDDLVLEAD